MTRFLGVVRTLEMDIPSIVEAETAEIQIYAGKNKKRSWIGRSTRVQQGAGLLTIGSLEFMPNCLLEQACNHEFYTASGTVAEILSDAAAIILDHPKWNDIYSEQEKAQCIEKIGQCEFLKKKFRYAVSDRLSNKKRLVRDKFVGLLGYDLISVRSVENLSSSAMLRRDKQIKELQTKLLGNSSDAIDTAYWRTASFEDLKFSETTIECDDLDFTKDVFFQNGIGPQVFRDFLGFDPRRDLEGTDGSILTLARLDAWLMTSIKLLHEKTSKGGHRQRLFQDAFNTFLDKSIVSVLSDIRETLVSCAEEELTRGACESGILGEEINDDAQVPRRKATLVREMPGRGHYYLCIRPEWFSQELTPLLGNIRDAYAGWCSMDMTYFKEFSSDVDWTIPQAPLRTPVVRLSSSQNLRDTQINLNDENDSIPKQIQ